MSDMQDVLVPDVGGEEVEIIEVCVAVGDSVSAEDSLITVESDKASMDIPAPFDGEIGEILVKVGDKVSQDSLIMKMKAAQAAVQEEAPAEPVSAPVVEEAPAPTAPEPQVEAAPAAEATSAVIEVHVPDIGDATDVDVIEVLVEAGEKIEKEAGLITLETDKATMDVPAPEAGVVQSISVKVGDKVSEGSLVLMLETTSSAPAAAPAAESAPANAEAPTPAPAAEKVPEPKRAPVPHHHQPVNYKVVAMYTLLLL